MLRQYVLELGHAYHEHHSVPFGIYDETHHRGSYFGGDGKGFLVLGRYRR